MFIYGITKFEQECKKTRTLNFFSAANTGARAIL